MHEHRTACSGRGLYRRMSNNPYRSLARHLSETLKTKVSKLAPLLQMTE